MLMRSGYKPFLLFLIGAILLCFMADLSPAYGQEELPRVKKAKAKKKKKEVSTADILGSAGSDQGSIDSIETMVGKLGYDYVAGTEGVNIKTPKPKPKKPYVGDYTGNTLMASNGLIEIGAPQTTPRGKFQVGAQYLHRRIQSSPDLQLNARVMFQTLTFGILKNAEVGFGSSGYYKSSNNTTFLTGKLRLTNPETSKLQASFGFQSIDFGTTGVSNLTNYFGLFSFDVHGSKIYFQLMNDGVNNFSNVTVRGGLIIQMKELTSQPSSLIVEVIQDANNNFSKYNFGIRTAVAENALFDLFLMKDININELSPAVGLNLKF
ncbi:MAG TPA: hypothetical protein PKK26_08520 [Candidatus Wallbacteria bacterium]|nr:hypothetical protein [Candidatus Wallbacteria bacterium]